MRSITFLMSAAGSFENRRRISSSVYPVSSVLRIRRIAMTLTRGQNRGNNGSDPQIRQEIRMAAASSRARISWHMAAKFQRPKSNFVARHEIRWFDDHNTEAPHSALDTGAAVPRNSPAVVPENFGAPRSRPEIPECSSLPYLQPYSEVASGYSPGNCARCSRPTRRGGTARVRASDGSARQPEHGYWTPPLTVSESAPCRSTHQALGSRPP